MLGDVLLHLATISIDTEELSVGEKYLTKCQEAISGHKIKPEIILINLNMLNHFGILWSQQEPEKSKIYLEKSERLFKAESESRNSESAFLNLEKLHTLTLYYLAQIYGALKHELKSALYCHNTLKRQLESKDYEVIDWVLNAATLSQFFMEKNGFKQSRHHLAASSHLLKGYEQELEQVTDRTQEFEAKMENFKHKSADVDRCWAKYGLLLLSTSRERLLEKADDPDPEHSARELSTDLAKLELEPESSVSQEDLQHLKFDSLDVSEEELQITDKYILTFEEAREVFQKVKVRLDKAQSYYTLETLASDYIEIVQDHCQLYFNLAFFEENPDSQAKIHKRRSDLLEGVVKAVNPKYYLQYCRQIWFELGNTYTELMNLKLDKLKGSGDRPTPHALTKINGLVEKGIQNFNHFIDSFKDNVTGEFPTKVDENGEKAFLQAYVHIGALYSRFITLDKTMSLAHVKGSYDAYKKVVVYCQDNEKAADSIKSEIVICREMVQLLPVKIAKLTQELS